MSKTYTVKDIVARYTVTERTVLVWIRSGDLKAINVGRSLTKKKPRWRITEKALDDFELLRASQTPTRLRGHLYRQDDVGRKTQM